MICRIARSPFFSLLLFLFLVLSFSFTLTKDSYAVSDISVTYDSSVSQWSDVFSSCTGDCLDDFSYLIVDISNYSPNNLYFILYTRFDGSFQRSIYISTFSSRSIYQLRFNGSPNNFLSFGQNTNFSDFGSVTFTLTENYIPAAPSGSITLTENGTFDVSSYSEAVVDVPMQVVPGDYHDDLVSINQSIIICAGTILVIYFFYCIYRMIIKGVS